MPRDENLPKVLHADPEHGGLRFVVILVLVFTLIIAFLLIQVLLTLLASATRLIEFATVLSCVVAIPLALGLTWLVELILKREWHSGKSITLDEAKLTYNSQKKESEQNNLPITFEWSKRINALFWYFELRGYPRAGRERRVSKNWLGLACQLHQDDNRLIVYCYFPPKQAAKWTDNASGQPFVEISLADVYQQAGKKKRTSASTRPTIDASLLTSAEGRYWLAEQRRWENGVELTRDDFEFYLDYVQQKIGSQT